MGGFLKLRAPPDTISQVLVVRDFVIGSGSGFSKIFVRVPGFVEKMTGDAGSRTPTTPRPLSLASFLCFCLCFRSLLTNHVSWKLNFVFPENITDLIEVEGTSGHFSTQYQKIGRCF